MKLFKDDLVWIRKGLACQIIQCKALNQEKEESEIKNLLKRFDVAEKEFFKEMPLHNK